MVTLEIALAIPIMLVLAVLMIWLMHLSTLQASAQDAARSVVRDLVRGVDRPTAEQSGARILPEADIRSNVTDTDARVTVTVKVRAPPPFRAIKQTVIGQAYGRME